MCYMLLLSTDSPEDLSAYNDSLIAFARELPGIPEESLLTHQARWFVGSAHGCSCGFRHLTVQSVELGFGEPVGWFPEESADIEATFKFIAIVRRLVEQGAQVECIDAWAHDDTPAALAGTVRVDLSVVTDRQFRFFENHRLIFESAPNSALLPRGPEGTEV